MANKNKIEIVLSAVDKGLRTGFNRALVSLKSFVTGAGKTKSSIMGMDMSLTGLITRLGAAVSVIGGLKKLTGITREFDKISAGLITATGSAENSKDAFGAIQDFATETPSDLAQVSEAFVKLVNYGLTPSERALTSYGNTSSALGKNLSQMIEAVADAATGEFERLKEFGIKARTEGDNVKFTFRGITTTVKKNAQEIEDYLINLGEVNFGDAMSNRMNTLDGLLSNLGDEWDKVFLNISQNGLGDVISDGVRLAISALQELNAMIASGELAAYLGEIVRLFTFWADDIKESIDTVKSWFSKFTDDLGIDGNGAVDGLINAFKQFPENVRAFIGIMTVEVAAGFDKVMARARQFKNSIKAVFTSETIKGVGEQYEKEAAIIDQAREESIIAILDERDTTIEASEAAIEEAKKRRKAYDEEQAANRANTEDRLAKYKIEVDASKNVTELTKKEIKEQKKLAEEKLRAAAQEKILALERQKIAASQLPTELSRAETVLSIDRQIMNERINLKRAELAAIKADTNASQAEIIKAESDLAEAIVNNEIELNNRLREIMGQRMQDYELAWRRGIISVEEYQAAVKAALDAGAIDLDEAKERMIASGDDMGAALALGMQKGRESMQTNAEMMIDIGENIGNQIADNGTNAFMSFINGTKSAKEAMADFASSTLSWLTQIIIKQMILNALRTFGFGGGGQVPAASYAGGGSVAGSSPSPTADNILSWLTAKEFVQPVKAVDYYGLPFMESIRRLKFPKHIAYALAGGTLPRIPSGYRLAQGGVAAGSPTIKTGDTNLAVVNVPDETAAKAYVKSSEFDTVIINKIRRNASTIKAVLK